MASDYKGLYVQRHANGVIWDVQVEDTAGNSISLTPDIYIERNVRPPINTLPTRDEYAAMQNRNSN